MKTTKKDLEAALRSICTQAHLYHADPQRAVEEMVRIAKQALGGEWGGVAPSGDVS